MIAATDRCSPSRETEASAANMGSLLIKTATREGDVLRIMVN